MQLRLYDYNSYNSAPQNSAQPLIVSVNNKKNSQKPNFLTYKSCNLGKGIRIIYCITHIKCKFWCNIIQCNFTAVPILLIWVCAQSNEDNKSTSGYHLKLMTFT